MRRRDEHAQHEYDGWFEEHRRIWQDRPPLLDFDDKSEFSEHEELPFERASGHSPRRAPTPYQSFDDNDASMDDDDSAYTHHQDYDSDEISSTNKESKDEEEETYPDSEDEASQSRAVQVCAVCRQQQCLGVCQLNLETYDKLINGWNPNNESILVGETTFLHCISHLFRVGPQQLKLSCMARAINDFITVLSTIEKFNKYLNVRRQVKSGNATVDLSSSRSYGAMLIDFEALEKSDVEREPDEVTQGILRLKAAICLHRKGSVSSSRSKVEAAVSDRKAEEFVRRGGATKNPIIHQLHNAILIQMLRKLKILRVHAGEKRQFISDLKELARLVGNEADFNGGTTCSEYFETFAIPGLERDDTRQLAAGVIFDTLVNLLLLGSTESGRIHS